MPEPPAVLLPNWAPRLKPRRLWQLYENDAQGMCDPDLLDEVGWTLYWRCKSFLAANQAVQGRAECPGCGAIILHTSQPDEILRCPNCGWAAPWRDYFQTIQHKQLSGGAPLTDAFQEFIDRFPGASDPHQKMLLIDILIHAWHWNARNGNTRAAAVNLIEGNYHQVVDFLDRLSYGPGSQPGALQRWQEWRTLVDRTADLWQDERLRRPPE